MTGLAPSDLVPSILLFILLCGALFALIELTMDSHKRRRRKAEAEQDRLNAEEIHAAEPKPDAPEVEPGAPVAPVVTETDPVISDVINGYFTLALKRKPTSTDRLLLDCGIYSLKAERNLTIARVALVVALGAAVALFFDARGFIASPAGLFFAACAVLGAAYGLPIIVLKRRAAAVRRNIASTFPDFLDIFLICMETGMTPEAALAQISRLMVQTERQFGIQLRVAVYEIHAGRTAYEALANFASRTRLDGASDLASLIQESVQLGLSVSKAVRVYAKEMRQTAILNAEERANALPVKMVFPLTLFLLPANMMVILSPTIINLVTSLKAFFGSIQN